MLKLINVLGRQIQNIGFMCIFERLAPHGDSTGRIENSVTPA